MKGGAINLTEINEQLINVSNDLDKIGSKVEKIQEGINKSKSVGDEETISTPTSSSDVKEWVTNKDIKFKDSQGSRVTLSFDRIMTLLNEKIRKGDENKSWGLIQSNLIGANSIDEVNKVIQDNELKFYNNLIMGGRRTRRVRKGRITKRRFKNRKNYKSRSHKKRH